MVDWKRSLRSWLKISFWRDRVILKITLKKLIVYFSLVFLAIALAGLYGMLHNQISYTVSPEYFAKFKFYQFGRVVSPVPERVRASIIGFWLPGG